MGRLWLTSPSNNNNASDQDIIYMSCDPADYRGNYTPDAFLEDIYESANLTAAIFYSRTSDYCEYKDISAPLQGFPIFSMDNRESSAKILKELSTLSTALRYFINIRRTDNNNSE